MAFMGVDTRCLGLFLLCTIIGHSLEVKVNPPQDFEIMDPGLLGYLYLQWKPPVLMENFKECTLEYELKYRNVDSDDWNTIITRNLIYKDGFDLNKGIEGKIRTHLSAQCTNGSEVQSSWMEASYGISDAGSLETTIQDMKCIYYNWQYLVCSWKPGKVAHSDTNYTMFFWYEGLDHALQCSSYLRDNEKNVGCKLSNLESLDYKDFFICVNGSSNMEPIRSSYTVFQLQNIVKPLPPEFLHISVENPTEMRMKWSTPGGPIPPRCYTYELVVREDGISRESVTDKNDMKLKKTANDSEELCFFVRSKVNIYCADDGIWSEWSEEECWEGFSGPDSKIVFLVPICLFFVFLLLLLCLIVEKEEPEPPLSFHMDLNKEAYSYEETLC
ncbi:interleukin-13 receptor subunit alpha-2-like [Peromyscus eremicus]|uniref:interleukin-13 receptor subunit alpha-2-like n=1 Tax=Peromyscus eremicus TaxID=42410 RepID=UPI0027DC78EF|nr:interleukin-13 receptor subunit alpha-2-like [Peromyscus eremicus]XP_059106488.1 interleukin-13 receptor subunit alpha-2-like [Peromyscus eremicus]XP_059106489.1 interleukin-13 receptor subunit alpha-2-like [Peromyscus eremicus]XP_059106490.1 interleukin-13 receptor subunit alpha-2-like [Peromyscus eremicus]